MNFLRKALSQGRRAMGHGRLFLLSAVFCLPIAFVVSLGLLSVLGRRGSFRVLVLVAIILFLGLLWPVALLLGRALRRISLSFRAANWSIYLLALLCVALIGYWIWSRYPPSAYNRPHRNYEVEIFPGGSGRGDICLLEIKNAEDQSIHPGLDSVSGFVFSGDWTSKNSKCRFYSPGIVPGSLKFNYAAQIDDVLTFLFRKTSYAGNALIRINGHPVPVSSLYSLVPGDLPIRAPVDALGMQVWNLMGVAGWTLSLLVPLILLVALPKDQQYERWLDGARAAAMRWVTILQRDIQLPSSLKMPWDFVEAHPWIPLGAVGLIAALFFWPAEYFDSSDMAYYLSLAKNLYHGSGYVNPDLSPAIYRGPVFPLLIALGYRVFGEGFRSALIVERLFWLLTVGMVYILGRKLYSGRTGFWAALFVLFAGVINAIFDRIWTDGPLIFLLLVLQWAGWEVYRKERGVGWYVLLGGLMGIGYMLKQTALFMVPVPLAFWLLIPEYRTRSNLVRLTVAYLVFACFVVGWMGYVSRSGGAPDQVTSDWMIGTAFLSYIGRSILAFLTGRTIPSGSVYIGGALSSPAEILRSYYMGDVLPYFRLPVLFPITLAYIAYRAIIHRSRPDILIGLTLLFYGSLIPTEVLAQIGPRQNLYLYVIVLIGCAAMIAAVSSFLAPIASRVLLTLLACALLGTEIGYNPPLKYFRLLPPQIFTPVRFVQPVDYFDQYASAAAWLDENTAPEDHILVYLRDANALHIRTAGNRRFEILNTCTGPISFLPAQPCSPPYISFWIQNGTTDPDAARNLIQGISETWLLSTIQQEEIRYVIVTPAVYSLYYYLRIHPDFEQVAAVGPAVIFRVIHPVQAISQYPQLKWNTCVGQGTPEYLSGLQHTNPAVYQAKLAEVFGPWMGLSARDLAEFASWQGCQLPASFSGEWDTP